MSTFMPLYDKLLVRRKEKETVSEGGIVLPSDITKEQPCEGVVLAVGCGKMLASGEIRPVVAKVGDKVLFGKFGGTEIEIDKEQLVVIREEDVIGIFGS